MARFDAHLRKGSDPADAYDEVVRWCAEKAPEELEDVENMLQTHMECLFKAKTVTA